MTAPETDYPDTQSTNADWAFQRYNAISHRLPTAKFPLSATQVTDLAELEDTFDAFIFDSFGVLNVGETPIPIAAPRISALRAAGKHVLVLTNAATGPLADLTEKYSRLGFDFTAEEIVSSRDVLAQALKLYQPGKIWGVVAPDISRIEELPINCVRLAPGQPINPSIEGLILLSSQEIDEEFASAIEAHLADHPMPVLVGNPDLVAPRETGFSLEPGSYAHDLADRLGIAPVFFGKPYGNAFTAARACLPETIAPGRIAMVGDTLHTDILGGAAAGLGTVLVTEHGVMKDMDAVACITTSGIVPNYVAPHI